MATTAGRCESFSSITPCTGCKSITSTACALMRCTRSSTTPVRTSLSNSRERVHAGIGRERHVHLILENDANKARYLEQGLYVAQWNDDIHHALHVLVTGERDGYYMDYADDPVRHLGRCLAEGFAYQGEVSAYREHAARGETSTDLPPQAFVSFLQSHDQAGNRAFGERITHIGQRGRRYAPRLPSISWRQAFPCCSWVRSSPRSRLFSSSVTSGRNCAKP